MTAPKDLSDRDLAAELRKLAERQAALEAEYSRRLGGRPSNDGQEVKR